MYRPEAIRGAISKAKNELVKPEAFEASTYWAEVTRRVYTRFTQEIMAANGALDFDDLLTRTTWLLQEQPEVLKRYQDRYQYLLVDEFQDTNTAQYELLQAAGAGCTATCSCVGDEDQSISAAGAAPTTATCCASATDYPGRPEVILLEQNYRSTQTVLERGDLAVITTATPGSARPSTCAPDRGTRLAGWSLHEADDDARARPPIVAGHDPPACCSRRGGQGRAIAP